MSLKDKVIICLIVVFVIILGVLLKSNADVMGQTTDKGLAILAKSNTEDFYTTVDKSWFEQELSSHIGNSGNDSTIAQTSATCLYEAQGYTYGSKYKITNIIDINWNKENTDYQAYAYWMTKGGGYGEGNLNLDSNHVVLADVFLQSMYNAYNTEKAYNNGNIIYTTTEKSAMKTLFYKAIETGGFLNQDGLVAGLSDFIAEKNGESATFKDDLSVTNASGLITEYEKQANSGYGFSNMDNTTIDAENNNITSKQKAADGNYTIFGPFNIYFYQPIESISIDGDVKNFIDYSGGQIYFSVDKESWSNNFSDIPVSRYVNGSYDLKPFYIKVSDSENEFFEQSKNVTITFNQKQITTYRGRFILLKVADGSGQNLMIYKASKHPDYSPSITFSVKEVDDEKEGFNIYINKTALGSSTPLSGAKFKIKVLNGENFIGWLKSDNGVYTYEGISYDNATTWTTSNNTQISINNLNKNYNYEIYETTAASGYTLSYQKKENEMTVTVNGSTLNDFGYREVIVGINDNSKKENLVFCGKVSYTSYPSGANMKVTNVKDTDPYIPPSPSYVDISGRVWIDRKGNKTGEYNNQYDDGEELAGVKVYLKRKSNNAIVKYNGKDYIETDSYGKYTFYGKYTNITSSALSNYYIEIEYEGIGREYKIVSSGTGDNQSKAIGYNTGSAWTRGINSSYKSHMNIGLFYDSTNDGESITKNIAYIKTNINGTEYKYKYGEQNKNMPFNTFDLGNAGYYRTIYASDIIYSQKVSDSLKVYITYAITVKNLSKTHSSRYPNYKKSYNYPHGNLDEDHERFMKVNLYDEYDATYYKLIEKNEDETWQNGSWSGENGKAEYSLELSFENAKKNPNNSQTIYVTYQLTPNALDKILKEGSFASSKAAYIEGKHHLAKYEEYYQYWDWVGSGKNATWTHIKDYYAWFDSDNPNPNSTNYEKYESSINGGTGIRYSNIPPGLRFSIYETTGDPPAERTITGTVFEDENEKGNDEVRGNGLFDQTASDSENLIQNVKVELLENDKKTVAKIYRLKTNDDGTFYVNEKGEYEIETYTDGSGNIQTGKPATTTTDSKGYYEFKGIIPR